MKYNLLFILVEGPDDERFFNKIIRQRFEKKNIWVKFYNYSTVKESKINKFLKSISAMGADYIFVADINLVPCVTLRDCSKISWNSCILIWIQLYLFFPQRVQRGHRENSLISLSSL